MPKLCYCWGMKKEINKALIKLHPDYLSKTAFNLQTEVYARNFTNNNLEIARFRLAMVSSLSLELLQFLSSAKLNAPNRQKREISLLNLIKRDANFASIENTQQILGQIYKKRLSLKKKRPRYINIF